MEISVYPFKLFKSDWYCLVYVNEYYMEISMDQFGEALKVLHGYFYVLVLIKNVWYCFVYVSEHCMYMENFTDCFETIFLSVNLYHMEISMYQFNLFNNDWYCFVCVKENYVEISMDLFGGALSYWNRRYCWQVFFCQKVIDFLIA